MTGATAALGRLSAAAAAPEAAPVIDPRRCLFTLHPYPCAELALVGMQREFGFFVPDKEYCVDVEGLLGYCTEKIWLGHMCIFCQRTFGSVNAAVRHMQQGTFLTKLVASKKYGRIRRVL